MDTCDTLINDAKSCRTKSNWEGFLSEHGEELAAVKSSKPVIEIYKLLRSDPQSLQYSPDLWASLIKGAISSWSLELGQRIANHSLQRPSASIGLPAAQVFLEQKPSCARDIANRTLRLSNLKTEQSLQLQMLISSSYAEERKYTKAIRTLEKLAPKVRMAELSLPQRAEFLMQMARMHFFLGRYPEGGSLFQEASLIFETSNELEMSTKALFNAAVCLHNSGGPNQKVSESFVSKCKETAEKNNFTSALAGIEAFYGLNCYQKGQFSRASKHFRKALSYLPAAETCFRKLHILSMLSYTHLGSGRFHLAKKFGEQTLKLAEQDYSQRFKTRFLSLKAELLWEDGKIEESQRILQESVTELHHKGIYTLEEMSTYNRFTYQSAILGEKTIPSKIKVEHHLRKNIFLRHERLFALGQLYINQGRQKQALEFFNKIVHRSEEGEDQLHTAVGMLGRAECQLMQGTSLEKIKKLSSTLATVCNQLGDTPTKNKIHLIQAAIFYREGNLVFCKETLKSAYKNPRLNFQDRFVIRCWLDTLEGKASRLTIPWQKSLLARCTKIYFQPSFRIIEPGVYMISDRFEVSLKRHPALSDLIEFLVSQNSFSSSLEEIQKHVWRQSLSAQGWQQKIRNTVMRVRDFFPPTIAPLLLHDRLGLRIFHEAIEVKHNHIEKAGNSDAAILEILIQGKLSSQQISERLQISLATTKRLLKKLTSEEKVIVERQGRNIFYSFREQK